jgi:NADH dehydrogenase FAD-containing subunit
MTGAVANHHVPTGASSSDLHRVVVVGGGAGGLELVTRLGDRLGRHRRADISLVERARTHLWKPLLHEVAAGSMDVSRHELDYLAQAHWHGFRYRFGEMIGLDRSKRLVHLAANLDDEGRLITPERSFGYDTLVIAIGSVTNDFGTPGIKENAIALDTPEQAQTTRDQDVFAMGDCAWLVPDGEKRPIPPRAQAAHQQASHLLKQITRRLQGQPIAPFVYRDFGSLVSLGEFSTIGSLMGFLAGKGMLVEGYVARLMYRSLYKMHETALHGPLKVSLDTIARALIRRTEPHVKLH